MTLSEQFRRAVSWCLIAEVGLGAGAFSSPVIAEGNDFVYSGAAITKADSPGTDLSEPLTLAEFAELSPELQQSYLETAQAILRDMDVELAHRSSGTETTELRKTRDRLRALIELFSEPDAEAASLSSLLRTPAEFAIGGFTPLASRAADDGDKVNWFYPPGDKPSLAAADRGIRREQIKPDASPPATAVAPAKGYFFNLRFQDKDGKEHDLTYNNADTAGIRKRVEEDLKRFNGDPATLKVGRREGGKGPYEPFDVERGAPLPQADVGKPTVKKVPGSGNTIVGTDITAATLPEGQPPKSPVAPPVQAPPPPPATGNAITYQDGGKRRDARIAVTDEDFQDPAKLQAKVAKVRQVLKDNGQDPGSITVRHNGVDMKEVNGVFADPPPGGLEFSKPLPPGGSIVDAPQAQTAPLPATQSAEKLPPAAPASAAKAKSLKKDTLGYSRICTNVGVVQACGDKVDHNFDPSPTLLEGGIGFKAHCDAKKGEKPCSPIFGVSKDGVLSCSADSTAKCGTKGENSFSDIAKRCALAPNGKVPANGKDPGSAPIDCAKLTKFFKVQSELITRGCHQVGRKAACQKMETKLKEASGSLQKAIPTQALEFQEIVKSLEGARYCPPPTGTPEAAPASRSPTGQAVPRKDSCKQVSDNADAKAPPVADTKPATPPEGSAAVSAQERQSN